MITLVLVRHAKSDWGDPGLADHDRPLNPRGTRDAPVMAARFAGTRSRIDRLLSSTATRARDTADVFGAALGTTVELTPELYASSADTLIRTAATSGADRVMLVAHDPGITALAERLSRGGITHMPTCAVAKFDWRADSWQTADQWAADEWSLDTPR